MKLKYKIPKQTKLDANDKKQTTLELTTVAEVANEKLKLKHLKKSDHEI